eukprot:1322666-Amorphochlora_amoeboformis.AAC.1
MLEISGDPGDSLGIELVLTGTTGYYPEDSMRTYPLRPKQVIQIVPVTQLTRTGLNQTMNNRWYAIPLC